MIGYITLGTNDIDKARDYYDALLGTVGAKRLMQLGEDAGGLTMWGVDWTTPAVAVTRPYNGQAAVAGNGNMAGIVFDERAKVDAFHAKALELGGSDEGAPGLRGEEGPQAFYGAYFRDPEGNKFSAFCVGPA